jgi:hypothetical protein
MSNDILIENAKLRAALAQIGGFARSWGEQVKERRPRILSSISIADKLHTIEQTCKAALEQPAPPQVRLTFVMVGCTVFSGTLIDDNPEHFEGCVEIEVVDVDPARARMRVIGMPTGKINEPLEIVGSVE